MRIDLSYTGNVVAALLAGVLGYLAPVSGVLTIVIVCILVDQIFGIIAARKRGHAIKSSKLWKTVKKIFYSTIIIALLFSMDAEIGLVPLHRVVAFVIAGWEVWSILENAAYITDHKAFRVVQTLMKDKVQDITKIDISDRENK
jgi:phage-related holin